MVSFAVHAQTSSEIKGECLNKMVNIIVMSSGGFYSGLQELAPMYEERAGVKIELISGSSMGDSPTSIPNRLKNGEDCDLVVMARGELDKLIEDDLAIPDSQTDLVLSKIGMCVRTGAPHPANTTTEDHINALLAAESIGYSASASGTYLAEDLWPRLGVWEQIQYKAVMVVGDRVGTWVARGDLEIGFQQVSEILPIEGVDFVGPLPDDIQKVTIFSAGLAKVAKQIEEANKFVEFLTSEEVYDIIISQGLEPAGAARK